MSRRIRAVVGGCLKGKPIVNGLPAPVTNDPVDGSVANLGEGRKGAPCLSPSGHNGGPHHSHQMIHF
jgi:hypothetical protein